MSEMEILIVLGISKFRILFFYDKELLHTWISEDELRFFQL